MKRKREKNRIWTTKEKEKIVIPVIEFKKTLQQTCREYDISSGLLSRWIEKYKAEGISGLENKRKPGNPMAKYFTTKKFNSKEEELEYENMRLKIENERLKKRLHCERRWFNCSIQEIKQKEFEIIEYFSKNYSVKSLCEIMNVSRSGYYKWLKNKNILNQYELNRKQLGELILDVHKRKPSYGYHRIRKIILDETGWVVSDNLVHKVCKSLNIKSKAKHYKYKKPGEESIKFYNAINGNWKTTRPFEKIVSDTTKIWFKRKPYDWTFYLDVFNNEIVGYDVRESMYGNGILNHKNALNYMLNEKIKRGYKDLDTIFHTDQGSVYSSVSFNNILNSYTITRSMSRVGTPTDNPVIESKNGWLKKEMYIDFDINNYNTVQEFIDDIVYDNNNLRPSYALNYKTPVEYRNQLGFN